MRLRPAAALVALTAVTAAAPSTASAVIVPQEGMRGLKLGMTVEEVRDVLGKPTRFRTVRSEITGPVREWRYGLTTVLFNSTDADAEVTTLITRSRTEKTAEGIGVGSSRRAVQRKVPGVRCLVEFTYDHCFVGRFTPGRTVTDFAMDSKRRVGRVTVGIVID